MFENGAEFLQGSGLRVTHPPLKGHPLRHSLVPPSLVPFNTSVRQVKTGFALASCFQPAGVEAGGYYFRELPSPSLPRRLLDRDPQRGPNWRG